MFLLIGIIGKQHGDAFRKEFIQDAPLKKSDAVNINYKVISLKNHLFPAETFFLYSLGIAFTPIKGRAHDLQQHQNP
jgi:hypothetical protein